MARTFEVHLPLEHAYTRRMLFAADVRDGATLARISDGLKVTATGLTGTPIVNADGFFVWLEEGNLQPQRVKIDPGTLPYENIDVPAPIPPARLVRIELTPRCDYEFAIGITGLRGTLIEHRLGSRVPATDAEIWLRWIDDTANGTTWLEAPTHSHTNSQGDFAAILRFLPTQIPRLDAAGGIRVRLAARRPAATLASPEFSLPLGRVASGLQPFAWDEFQP